jgi:hypothetical protein
MEKNMRGNSGGGGGEGLKRHRQRRGVVVRRPTYMCKFRKKKKTENYSKLSNKPPQGNTSNQILPMPFVGSVPFHHHGSYSGFTSIKIY